MALVIKKSASTAGNPVWIHLAGSIQEVLDELQNQNVASDKNTFWTDDATDARAVFCRQ